MARIVDFLWIAISWQSPRWYRYIVTIATSADDRHQAHGQERAKQWRHLCWTGVHTPWRSHAMVHWWPGLTWCSDQLATVQGMWQRTHVTTAAGELSADFSHTGVDRYANACSHGLDLVLRRSSHTSSVHLGYCNAMPTPAARCDSGGRRGGGGHGTVLTAHPFLHVPCPASSCILLLLKRFDLTGEAVLTWLDTALVVLFHSGAVNLSGKMMYVTSSHAIATRRYRRANFVLRYRRTEKSATISYVVIIRFGICLCLEKNALTTTLTVSDQYSDI